MALQRRRRIGQVGRVDARHDQGAELAAGGGGEDRRGVAAGLAGQRALAPGPGHLGAGRGVGHRPADGQQPGQGAGLDRAALAGPAGHPGQPRARRGREPGHRGQRARHLGQPLADQDHRARRVERLAGALPQGGPGGSPGRGLRESPPGWPAASAVSAPASSPGSVASSVAGQLGQPGAGERRDREHPQAVAPDRLAQPQEDDRRLVLGLEAGQQHGRGLLQVGVADADAAPGHARGQELLLLGRVRPGPQVDVVGVQRHPGELGVGVGVLEGQPAAGQHADAAGAGAVRRRPCGAGYGAPRAAARPAAATASACGQDAGTSTPFSSLTSGVVSRSGWVA